jgi:uncharacterized protein YbjT (DUF2867 family)
MSGDLRTPSQKLVTVFGGSGFLGRAVVHALAKRGYRIRVAVRRPDLAGYLQPLGQVGQIVPVQANLRYPASVRHAATGADAVINLVGILAPSGRQNFSSVQSVGARLVAEATAPSAALVHVSAIGADPESESDYARSKAEGEAAVLAARPDAVVLRPSIIFGEGDGFFTRFASLARMLPVLPLAGADTLFQPVFVGDVAEVIARAVDGKVEGGKVYELGGPETRSFRDLVNYVLEQTGRRRLVASLPWPLAKAQAGLMEVVDTVTFGLLPEEFRLTRDQVTLLRNDNVVSDTARREGRTLEGLGVTPTGIEAVAPSYLVRFRPRGQFDRSSRGQSTGG